MRLILLIMKATLLSNSSYSFLKNTFHKSNFAVDSRKYIASETKVLYSMTLQYFGLEAFSGENVAVI